MDVLFELFEPHISDLIFSAFSIYIMGFISVISLIVAIIWLIILRVNKNKGNGTEFRSPYTGAIIWGIISLTSFMVMAFQIVYMFTVDLAM